MYSSSHLLFFRFFGASGDSFFIVVMGVMMIAKVNENKETLKFDPATLLSNGKVPDCQYKGY